MDSIKISKQKHIQFCLSLFIVIVLLGLTLFALVLGLAAENWSLKKSYYIAFAFVFFGEIFVPICVFIVLRVTNKSYYVITPNSIKLFNAGKEVFVIPSSAIKGLKYLSFKYAFLFQMGAGYLSIPFDEAYGKIKPTMTFPDMSMLLGIDMTEKQAHQVAKILGKELQE